MWHDTYAGEAPPVDGTAWVPAAVEERVVRGGHWGCGAQMKLLTPYTRQPDQRDQASTQVGFRVVWDESSTASKVPGLKP
ncbi:MAG: SUMF1/EgtB/PvdO family nonheme iron enzyme [Bryobacteraceae bacterium]|nr:SUMF1/EgtB/PvdO family nonheme iron enzyme [Bryobacteraceae bacterium]